MSVRKKNGKVWSADIGTLRQVVGRAWKKPMRTALELTGISTGNPTKPSGKRYGGKLKKHGGTSVQK